MKERSKLIFEGGALAVRRAGYDEKDIGGGWLIFRDGDLEYEYGSETEGAFRLINLPRSELVAIRDFLIRELAPLPENQEGKK